MVEGNAIIEILQEFSVDTSSTQKNVVKDENDKKDTNEDPSPPPVNSEEPVTKLPPWAKA